MAVEPGKIAIVGAGAVGATTAFACLTRRVGRTVALYDHNRAKVDAEVLDLAHGLQFVETARVTGGDDVEACRDAQVVVITAGARQRPGQTRLELGEDNVAMIRSVVPSLLAVAPDTVLLMVTNPVDVLTMAALEVSGLPWQRVIGSGTVLDSSRFRYLVAQHLGVGVPDVHAYVVGEHGDSEVPLWSAASLGNVPLTEATVDGRRLDDDDRDRIYTEVRDSAQMIIRGKGATNYAIGLATARILRVVLSDSRRVLPVSSRMDGYQGVSGVCLSVPCVLGAAGVVEQMPVAMSADESAAFRRSAQAVRDTADRLGLA